MISIPDLNCQFPRLAGPREITHKFGLSFVTYTIAIDVYIDDISIVFVKLLSKSKSRMTRSFKAFFQNIFFFPNVWNS